MKKFIIIIIFQAVQLLAHEPVTKTNASGDSYYEEAKFKKGDIGKAFYYIRHGQTDVNKYKIAIENNDVPLNEEGMVQVKRASKLLLDKNIKIIVASPYVRTRQTAEIINKELNVPIIYHEGLKEPQRGILKGENINKSKNKKNWSKGVSIPGVESLYQFEIRVHNTIKEIIGKYDNVLIVGHGVYFRYLTFLLNDDYIYIKNAAPFYFNPISENEKLYKITPLM